MSDDQPVSGTTTEKHLTLRRWLLGRLALMALNGIVTAVALWLLGVPLALTLGLLLATPLTACLLVIVEMLYSEDALGDKRSTEAG